VAESDNSSLPSTSVVHHNCGQPQTAARRVNKGGAVINCELVRQFDRAAAAEVLSRSEKLCEVRSAGCRYDTLQCVGRRSLGVAGARHSSGRRWTGVETVTTSYRPSVRPSDKQTGRPLSLMATASVVFACYLHCLHHLRVILSVSDEKTQKNIVAMF